MKMTIVVSDLQRLTATDVIKSVTIIQSNSKLLAWKVYIYFHKSGVVILLANFCREGKFHAKSNFEIKLFQ